jgi:preprotein translocase subunit YajC
MKSIECLTVVAIAAVLAAPAAWSQQSQQKLSSCSVGQKVLTPGGKPGTVVEVTANKACRVKQDDGMSSGVWSAFMLSPAPGTVAAAADIPSTPKPGMYQCYGGQAGNMKLRFSAGNTYANEQGKSGSYKMRPSGQMEFTSGPWAGFYAKTLENGRVGLTSRADSRTYMMTCEQK